MLSLIFVALFSVTNVQTGEVIPDAIVGQVESVSAYAQMYNDHRGQVLQGDDGNEYAVSDARIVVLQQNEEGNVVYPNQE